MSRRCEKCNHPAHDGGFCGVGPCLCGPQWRYGAGGLLLLVGAVTLLGCTAPNDNYVPDDVGSAGDLTFTFPHDASRVDGGTPDLDPSVDLSRLEEADLSRQPADLAHADLASTPADLGGCWCVWDNRVNNGQGGCWCTLEGATGKANLNLSCRCPGGCSPNAGTPGENCR